MGSNETCSRDNRKQEIVFAGRGIDFADLRLFFKDVDALTQEDTRMDYGEPRFNMLASHENVILNVTFTPRAGKFHVISARIASRKERKIYAERKTFI